MSFVDECILNSDDCSIHATCINTLEGFNCTCNTGYTGNGVTCYGMYALKAVQLTLLILGVFGWCSTGGVFHLHSLIPFSLKLDDSNFVQNYFGVRSI